MGLEHVRPESVPVQIPEECGFRVIPQHQCVQFIARNKLDIRPTVVTVPITVLSAAYVEAMLLELHANGIKVNIPPGMIQTATQQRGTA